MAAPTTREGLLAAINNTGIGRQLNALQQAILFQATKTLNISNNLSQQEELSDQQIRNRYDQNLLDAVGPAAASSAVEYTINKLKKQGLFRDVSFNGSFTNNVRIAQNSPVEECGNFSNVLRQFLLPRYAYLDFDRIVDPRHQIDQECGYPKFITPIMYRYMYDRDDVARRINDIFPDESWAADPEVYEDDDENVKTDFELGYKDLCDRMNLTQYMYRIDKLAGIGHYGALLLGIDDGRDLEAPIEGIDSWGRKDPNYTKQRQLLYLRPFDEYLSFIHQYETDQLSPRYGLPKFYNLVFLDMTIDAAGASIGTRLNRRVHWTRVVHVADNLQSSLVFGIPRMQPVFNRLLDLRKIKGSSAEMFWKGGFPGLAIEINPQFVADNPEFDKESTRRAIQEYADGLSRYLALEGMSVKSLAPQVADPSKHVNVQMQAVAAAFGIPLRIFMGSEEGRLASSQDKLTWNTRLSRKIKTYTEPYLIRNLLNRLCLINVLPTPKQIKIGWADLNAPTDEDKANLALKWTQALSQYVASGVIHLIPPMDYLTTILGLRPSDALKIIDKIEKDGGFAKLKKVDPSQGSGVNGKATNSVPKGQRTGTTKSRPAKRNTATKSNEGKTS